MLDIFTENELSLLSLVPEVQKTREAIDAKEKGSISFSIEATDWIRERLLERMGLRVGLRIPMRWIKGDTATHIDAGASHFQDTYLVYLTESAGEFILENESYPITKGKGFVFHEGTRHGTYGTEFEPRLLLGPMSEQGFAVGGSPGLIANGATDTVYIRQDASGNILAKINDGEESQYYFPLTITNSSDSPESNKLKVIFTSNFTISNNNDYFVCNSSGIQFGSTSLNGDGTRRVFTISVDNYDGLIQNGTGDGDGEAGYNHIYVYNLIVDGSDRTTQVGAGWIGKQYFGNRATNNYIVNCSSYGSLAGGATGGGGILGAFAGRGSGATLFVYGCSTYGNMGQLDGGIIGARGGSNGGSVKCEQCWSEGTIGSFAGGIFGDYAGDGGYAEAKKCYSLGNIGGNGGGIYGRYAGNNGQAVAEKCYSRGTIAADAGGIYGLSAASNSGTATATNCYSSGAKNASGGGIYGTGKGVGGTQSNCYAAEGSWNSTTANQNLLENPGTGTYGQTWIKITTDNPYELNSMGFTPYSTTNINASNSTLVQTYSQTITQGESTITGLTSDSSGNNFRILNKEGGDSGSHLTITISAQTGRISTTTDTKAGVYTIVVRSVGSYNITQVQLTVQALLTCCERPMDLKGLDYKRRNELKEGNLLIGSLGTSKTALTYTELYKIKNAYASKY